MKIEEFCHIEELISVDPYNKKAKYYFLNCERLFLSQDNDHRWIEYTAIDYVKINMFSFLIYTPIGGDWIKLNNAILFKTRKECMKQKEKLNYHFIKAEYLKNDNKIDFHLFEKHISGG